MLDFDFLKSMALVFSCRHISSSVDLLEERRDFSPKTDQTFLWSNLFSPPIFTFLLRESSSSFQ